jgi:GNAT superfamily N-acetyltransferase
MKPIELVTPEPAHVPELGRICFEAFRTIHDRHNFPRDFPDLETAVKVVGLLSSVPEVFGIAARDDGRWVGSNFMLLTDPVAGVGPITVDPACHGNGVGRKLMQAVLDHATQRGIERVRLLQDSFNTASLSLYASLGFDVREPIGVLRAPPAVGPDPTVRPATQSDLPALAQLSVRLYRSGRDGEIARWLENGIPFLVRETGGVIRGYLGAGKLGHGVAETEADALALIGQLSRHAPPGLDVFFLPLRLTSLYRAALRDGCRLLKIMTLMTRGPYDPPPAIWMPSVLY